MGVELRSAGQTAGLIGRSFREEFGGYSFYFIQNGCGSPARLRDTAAS
jgi:hypothetical protein